MLRRESSFGIQEWIQDVGENDMEGGGYSGRKVLFNEASNGVGKEGKNTHTGLRHTSAECLNAAVRGTRI